MYSQGCCWAPREVGNFPHMCHSQRSCNSHCLNDWSTSWGQHYRLSCKLIGVSECVWMGEGGKWNHRHIYSHWSARWQSNSTQNKLFSQFIPTPHPIKSSICEYRFIIWSFPEVHVGEAAIVWLMRPLSVWKKHVFEKQPLLAVWRQAVTSWHVNFTKSKGMRLYVNSGTNLLSLM